MFLLSRIFQQRQAQLQHEIRKKEVQYTRLQVSPSHHSPAVPSGNSLLSQAIWTGLMTPSPDGVSSGQLRGVVRPQQEIRLCWMLRCCKLPQVLSGTLSGPALFQHRGLS